MVLPSAAETLVLSCMRLSLLRPSFFIRFFPSNGDGGPSVRAVRVVHSLPLVSLQDWHPGCLQLAVEVLKVDLVHGLHLHPEGSVVFLSLLNELPHLWAPHNTCCCLG